MKSICEYEGLNLQLYLFVTMKAWTFNDICEYEGLKLQQNPFMDMRTELPHLAYYDSTHGAA
jgi:hypothetical protein